MQLRLARKSFLVDRQTTATLHLREEAQDA
jgi:hypothetical protein